MYFIFIEIYNQQINAISKCYTRNTMSETGITDMNKDITQRLNFYI